MPPAFQPRGNRCNLCGYQGEGYRWRGHAQPVLIKQAVIGAQRRKVDCPQCGSSDRDRLCYAYLQDVWKPAPSTRVLHIAPERQLSLAIRKLLEGQHHQTEYLGLDKRSGLYRYPAWVQKGDITNLPFPPQHFDLLIANHVLEHIRDLDLALAEIKRVLKPGGLLIAQVPWAKELTISSLSPALPLLKRALWQRKHHGQWDHAWLFGQDLTRLMAKQNFSPQFWQPEADSQLFINALEPLMLYKN